MTAFHAANATSTRRQHEHDGLVYLISSAQGILLQDADYAAATTAEDFNALLSMFASTKHRWPSSRTMTTIPTSAIGRYEQLQRLATMAMAMSEGLRPEADHWRDQISRLSIGLSDVRRQYGELTIGSEGEAYLSQTRTIARNSNNHRIETYETADQRRPDLDGYTKPLFIAQGRLSDAREQQAQAANRAGALRQVAAEAKQALRERGWREER